MASFPVHKWASIRVLCVFYLCSCKRDSLGYRSLWFQPIEIIPCSPLQLQLGLATTGLGRPLVVGAVSWLSSDEAKVVIWIQKGPLFRARRNGRKTQTFISSPSDMFQSRNCRHGQTEGPCGAMDKSKMFVDVWCLINGYMVASANRGHKQI